MAPNQPRLTRPEVFVLDRLQRFVDKHFKQQPPALRALVYFLFVALFLYTCFRMVGGDYVVSGHVLANSGNNMRSPVRDYDLALDGVPGQFGTNSQGKYYLALTPSRYYALFATGSLTVNLILPDSRQMAEPQVLEFNRLTQTFRPLLVVPPAQAKTIAASPSMRNGMSFEIVPAAYAAGPSDGSDRLFVDGLYIPGTIRINDAELELESFAGDQPLMTASGEADDVPLSPGSWVSFGDQYWFNVPAAARRMQVKLDLQSRPGWFTVYKQKLKFQLPSQYGIFSVRVKNGVQARMRLVSASDLLFPNDVVPEAQAVLVQVDLWGSGVRTILVDADASSATGYTLVVGRSVAVSSQRAVLRRISQIPLSPLNIQYDPSSEYQIVLRRGLNPGSSAISSTTLAQLVASKDDRAFTEVMARLRNGT